MDDADVDLIRRVAGGDTVALGALYDRHIERVMTYAIGRCRDPHEVADLVASVWISVWTSAGAFDPTRGEVIGWILGIAAHRFADLRRSEQRTTALLARLAGRRYLEEDDIDRISERIDAAHAATDASAALAGLPMSQRTAFELLALNGMSAEDAAATAGTTPTAMRMRLSRARRSLRHEVASSGAFTPANDTTEELP